MPTFSSWEKGLNNLWAKCEVMPGSEEAMTKAAKRIVENKARYKKVEQTVGVPWWWIGITHLREANLDFEGVLHNGDKIIGKGTKTTHVPEGRGPFATWEEAADDALRLKDLDEIKDWSVARALYEFERYNGFGYTTKGINSPYVWAHTNLQQRGKFISDHGYDASAWDTQPGCAAVLKQMIALGEVQVDEPEKPPIVIPGGGTIQLPEIGLGQLAAFLPIGIQVLTYILTHENMTKEQQQQKRQELLTGLIQAIVTAMAQPKTGGTAKPPVVVPTTMGGQMDFGSLFQTLLPLGAQLLGGPLGTVGLNLFGQFLQNMNKR